MIRMVGLIFVLTLCQLFSSVNSAKASVLSNRGRNYDGILSVNITVSDAPKLVALVDELSNPEATNATITCSIGSGNLQGLTYEWFKNDKRITADSASGREDSAMKRIRIDIPADNYQSVLRIFNLEPSDAALYSCVAKNRFGQDRIATKLDVKVQLKWTLEPPGELTVSAGKSLLVPCRAHGNPMPQVEWYKINDDDNNNNGPAVATGARINLGPELRYSSVEPQQAGTYECRASNGAEEDLVARLKLNVLVVINSKSKYNFNMQPQLDGCSNLALLLSLSAVASIALLWPQCGSVKLVNAVEVNVTVSKAPKIVDLIEKLNHPEGTNATITCSVGSGELNGLTYEWFKNNERLQGVKLASDKLRIDIPADNYQSTLRVFNLELDDAGTYSCVAKNRFGQDKISTKLNVKVQLKWIEKPTDTKASAGRLVSVPCSAQGSPEPRVQWRRLQVAGAAEYGEALVDNTIGQSKDGAIHKSELRFLQARPEHAGLYECRASNEAEEDLVAAIKLDVLGK